MPFSVLSDFCFVWHNFLDVFVPYYHFKVFSDIAGSPLDSMLQQLAYYKRHNPGNAEEQEMMENLFDCLCSLLLHSPNRYFNTENYGAFLIKVIGIINTLDYEVQ